MNLKKSINHALIDHEKNIDWLADQLGLKTQSIYYMQKQNSTNVKTLEKMAGAFGMSVSDFIALGETKK